MEQPDYAYSPSTPSLVLAVAAAQYCRLAILLLTLAASTQDEEMPSTAAIVHRNLHERRFSSGGLHGASPSSIADVMRSGTVGRSSFESPATSPVSHVWRRVQRLYNLDLTPLESGRLFQLRRSRIEFQFLQTQ
nr:uncharacterized protein LOC127296963 [Lolium perenne]